MESSTTNPKPPLHKFRVFLRAGMNRVFAGIYVCAIFSLLYYHSLKLFHSTTTMLSFFMLISDLLLAFMWLTTQPFRMRPIIRQEFPENLKYYMDKDEFPAMDIFICTADPYKEPPISVVNTALSVMAYDYPAEKISVYVSDDGGSELTLFAFMEAAKFASYWLPFCRENQILERSPDAYFSSNQSTHPEEAEKMKLMYESMKIDIQNVVEKGKVNDDSFTNEHSQLFSKWTREVFTRQHHPTIIQVLLEIGKDKDVTGRPLPNLVYMSRQKSRTSPHHFKAGALNTLLRVSAVMTNAPIVLTLDCDNYSNDPQTPHRMLCYFLDSSIRPKLGYVQFPQRFHGLNRADIYASEFKWLYICMPTGMDGLQGPTYVGSGCFFCRRAFFGGPSQFIEPDIPELSPYHVLKKPIMAQSNLDLAHEVARCSYEIQTKWGSKMGFRYGSMSEDFHTCFWLQCEGWNSIFCNPDRPAFLGDIPITLNDALNQTKRWALGLGQVAFSKFSPITFGIKAMGPLMGLAYAHNAFWPIWSIPITIYAFIPQLALLNNLSVFPKVTDSWFFLYVFLFLGAYGQDGFDFILTKGTFEKWWNNQRMWLIRGPSSFLFGTIEFVTKLLGIATQDFSLTNKAVDDEQSKRYDQGIFEFGVASPIFIPLVMAAMINLVAFLGGLFEVLKNRDLDSLFLQLFLAGFGVLNSWPIYEAMVLRSDKGKMPAKATIFSTLLAWALYKATSLILKM